MAPLSPRRSSRARIPNTHSLSSASSSGLTSTSSATSHSARPERSTRSHRQSSNKSTPSISLSSESPDDYDDIHITRSSRRRGPDDDSIHNTLKGRLTRLDPDMGNGSYANDEIQEEDEAVRCVCGFDEYPGPPPVDTALPSSVASRSREKDHDTDFFSGIEFSEDVSGFYVQCDVCKVWQHGACVSIMSEESSPDEYYCEKCRKDLHKIHIASNGQRYSHYTFATRASRANSRAASSAKDRERDKEPGSGSRSGRASTASQTAKRRSTMNSRDAAYDEEEELRRAIEASKEDAPPDANESTSRRPKRGRSDSEENSNVSVKRQRTSSPSLSPSADKADPSNDESEDSSSTRNTKRSRQSRPSHRETCEHEEKERQRQEAVNKRRVRADWRRADGSASREPEKGDTNNVGHKETADVPQVEEDTKMTKVDAAAAAAEPVVSVSVADESADTTIEATTTDEIVVEADVTTTSVNPDTEVLVEANKDKTKEEANIGRDVSLVASRTPVTSKAAPNPPSAIDHPAPIIGHPDTPPQVATPAPAASARKTTKASKKGRGRNQYTRDREDIEDLPAHSTRESRHKTTAAYDHYSNGTSTRQSRHDSKNNHSHGQGHGNVKGKQASGKLSIPELKRRSAAFLDFITKTQLELAAEATPSHSNSDTSNSNSREPSHDHHAAPSRTVADSSKVTEGGGRAVTPEPSMDEKDFGDLTCGEMMDVLTRDLLKWQSQYLS